MNTEAVEAKRPFFDAIIKIIPDAAIAGGYLRDLLMDIPTRDIDIFTSAIPTSGQITELQKILSTHFAPHVFLREFRQEELEQYTKEEDLARTSDIQRVFKDEDQSLVDLIVVDNVSTHIREFPDSISKVWYSTVNGTPTLSRNNAFVYSHAHKVICYRQEGSWPRLSKLMRKYPDYAVTFQTAWQLGARELDGEVA